MNPFKPVEIKIALIGGGTGSFTLLSSLKNYSTQIAALVNMADDGGSTGVLRDELGTLPPGDVRQCLVALSRVPEVRDLFNYRFDRGSMKGHAFGNLFLTALEKMTGDFAKAVELASEVLNIDGVVVPITLSNVQLYMSGKKGRPLKGEYKISQARFDGLPTLWLEPRAVPNPTALEAIENADMVIIAPGNLYGSLAPALLVDGIGKALRKTKALKVYVCNLITKPGQTSDFTVDDFASEIERMAGEKFLDVVLYNTAKPSDELIKKYAKDGERPVLFNEHKFKTKHYESIGLNLLAGSIWKGNSADPIGSSRTLIRHDSDATARALIDIYNRYSKS